MSCDRAASCTLCPARLCPAMPCMSLPCPVVPTEPGPTDTLVPRKSGTRDDAEHDRCGFRDFFKEAKVPAGWEDAGKVLAETSLKQLLGSVPSRVPPQTSENWDGNKIGPYSRRLCLGVGACSARHSKNSYTYNN